MSALPAVGAVATPAVITRFYDAFAALDAATMSDCYHDSISFSDPVFPDLRGRLVTAMWRMLCGAAKDWKFDYQVVFADDRKAQVRWTARYRFGKRQVSNQALSTLTIWDDKIVRHVDEFGFYRWSRQAFGGAGLLLGALPLFRKAVQRKARARLDRFERE